MLYNKGMDKIDLNLDLVKIIKNLQNIKIVLENSLMN